MAYIEQQPALQEQRPANLDHFNWTSSVVGKLIAATTLAAEISPLNEAVRLAAFGVALKYGDPVSAALVAGTTTMALEGAAAVVTADMLDTNGGRKSIAAVNQKLEKIGADKVLKTGFFAEAALSLTGGSAVVTLAKHRQNPTRTRKQNRFYGMNSAAGISAVTTGQAFLLGEGINNIPTNQLVLGAIAVGAVIGGAKWLKNKRQNSVDHLTTPESTPKERQSPERITLDNVESEQQLDESVKTYAAIVYDEAAPQHLGLSEEEVRKALQNPAAYKAMYKSADGHEVALPFLVPLKELYWYNTPHLTEKYGSDELYYYAHTPGAFGENDPETQTIKLITDNGGVIIYDINTSASGEVKGNLGQQLQQPEDFISERLGGKQERFLNQYASQVTFRSGINSKHDQYKAAAVPYQRYLDAVESGVIAYDPQEGTALTDCIDGEDAQALWKLYKRAFDKIGDGHPVNAGFDESEFLHILADKDVVKVVDRVGGKIAALALFLSDFKDTPWLNSEYFAANHKEAFETNNIFIFTGIVADKQLGGGQKSAALINLLMKVVALRETPVLLTFECGDESAKYVPKLVSLAINHRSEGHVSGLRKQIAQLSFHAIRKLEA